MKIVLAITGASGVIYGIRFLEKLKLDKDEHTVHLILSDLAKKNIEIETHYTVEEVVSMADFNYENNDLDAKLSSGSFKIDCVAVVPCSMKSLASIAVGYSDNLISRVCDVAIKEGRKLVLSPRESPLNAIHLENMLKLSRLGVKIIPPMPAFYNNPRTIEDIINHHIMKILDNISIENELAKRW